MDVKKQHLNEYLHYLLTESNIVHKIFDAVVEDMVGMIEQRLIIKRPIPEGQEEVEYTGWCYDSIKQRIEKDSTATKYHPIYLYYFSGKGLGMFNVSNRFTDISREELEHDNIYIGANITELRNTDVDIEEQLRTALNGMVHEFTHVKNKWETDDPKIIRNATKNTYVEIDDNFFSKHSITWEIPQEMFNTIKSAYQIINDEEIEAICNACDTFIMTYPRENIIDVIKHGSTDDEKAEVFISKYHTKFGFWFGYINEVLYDFTNSLVNQNNIALSLLYAQVSVFFGKTKDCTGYMKDEQWTYTNDILTGKRVVERRTVDTIREALKYFREKVFENYAKVKETVINSLKEDNLIQESKLYESAFHIHNVDIYAKTKIDKLPGFAGPLSLWMYGKSEFLSEPVREICRDLFDFYKTDYYTMKVLEEQYVMFGNSLYTKSTIYS